MKEIEALIEELEQTQIAYEIATQINHLKTGFLGRIAHELRSPLSSLMGLHQLILADLCESPQEERECISQAYQAARRLLKIIDDVVTVSKIEYGTIPLELAAIALNDVLGDLHQLTHLQAANRNLQLKMSATPSDLSVVADYQRLLYVLLLLVDGLIGLQDRGAIQILARYDNDNRSGLIQLDSDCPLARWSSELEFDRATALSDRSGASLYLKFLLSEKLIEMMAGEIHLLEREQEEKTKIQIVLPLRSSDVSVL
jgi:K+-sensing histidine kinase KdpD